MTNAPQRLQIFARQSVLAGRRSNHLRRPFEALARAMGHGAGRLLPVALLPMALIHGCSGRPSTYEVQGRVVFDNGDPVTFGSVEFRPVQTMEDGGIASAQGKIDQQGRFTLQTFAPSDGAVAGEHQVIVVQVVRTDVLAIEKHQHARQPLVDRRFADYATSGLTADVKADDENAITLTVQPAIIDPSEGMPSR
jgi:hypothetical protein